MDVHWLKMRIKVYKSDVIMDCGTRATLLVAVHTGSAFQSHYILIIGLYIVVLYGSRQHKVWNGVMGNK